MLPFNGALAINPGFEPLNNNVTSLVIGKGIKVSSILGPPSPHCHDGRSSMLW